MSKRKYIWLVLFLLIVCSCQSEVRFDNESEEPQSHVIALSLSNQSISCVAEDSVGYIWFGTNRGLNRYNGDVMHQYFCDDQPNDIPDNRINDVFCDSKGRIWVSTKNGVARYTDSDDFEQIRINGSLRSQKVIENHQGEIFLVQTEVVMKYNESENCFEKFLSDKTFNDPFSRQAFIDIEDNLWLLDEHHAKSYSTKSGNVLQSLDLGNDPFIQASQLASHYLWIALDSGLRIWDVVTSKWVDVPETILADKLFAKAHVNAFIMTYTGHVLICTSQGLFSYDTTNDYFIHEDDPSFPFAAPDFPVNLGMTARNGAIWFCSESQGFAIRQPIRNSFNHRSPIVNLLRGKPIADIALDSHNTVWLATQTEGIYSYSTETRQIAHFSIESFLPSLRNNPHRIYSIYVDTDDDIWISMTPKGLYQLRRKEEGLELIKTYNLPVVIVINQDSTGTLWAGSYGNSYYSKRPKDIQFAEHHLFSNTFCYMSCMELLQDGSFATLVRDQGLRFIDPNTLEQQPASIPDSVLGRCIHRSVFLPSALKEDAQGRLWIGTISNGLLCFDRKTGILEEINGAPCEDIASIEIDQQGFVWISTQYGIGKYNPDSRTFTNYYSSDGLGGNEFVDRASCRLPNGTLIFGGPHGITAFNPNNMPEVPSGNIYLENLKIHNHLVHPGPGMAIEKQLSLADAVRLGHSENSFCISFSALDFSDEERFNYQYKLEGVNKNWIEAQTSREAVYANVEPGDYIFKARITNKDRDHVIAETSIPVVVLPPLWGTWWARLLFTLLGIAVVFYIWRLYSRIRREKWNRLQSQREKEQEHRINQMNMSFFANVSHEFRTPLTVISGPIGQLCQKEDIGDDDRRLLQLVNRSVKRMLQLVNQMMDFHKLSDGALRLEVRHQDIVGYLQQSAEFFSVNAKDKNIKFSTQGLEDFFLMWMDADKVDKMVGNLLGNAMKYTPAHGEVILSFDVVNRNEALPFFSDASKVTDTQYVKICVTDTGNGIPEEEREKIFDRYYQLHNTTREGSSNWGTGIGLYYARSLALLHHGALRALGNPNGKGAQFCLLLPINKSAYSESEFADTTTNQAELYPLKNQTPVVEPVDKENTTSSEDENKPHILVVDDDVEVVHYMKLLLSKDYHVTCRFDAVTALETLQRQDREVDLIVSDVMMPGTTGFELCKQVKEDSQLCHIPVILVTAKNTPSDQIEGIKTGAVAYVTKPFDPEYLKALIDSLLKGRDHIRQILQDNTQTDVLEENALSSQDKAFMTELYRLMEEELANPDMDISRMTDLLHISRSKLYYKIKGLTGENPSVFFKHYKLNRAAEMLKEGKYNISEISLLTGFSTLSHFSASFKKQFGVTPSEY